MMNKKKSMNIPEICWGVLNGFIAALGVATVAFAFTVSGWTGLLVAGLGVGIFLSGLGLFAANPFTATTDDSLALPSLRTQC